MKKIIGIYGGSFNPSTEAHRDIGEHVLKQIPVDEVWYLVSPQNPFKPTHGMAPFEHRVAMARLNVQDNPKLIVQDIEARYAAEAGGSTETSHTLRCLTRDFPDAKFIWIMGADSMSHFHKWGDADYIMDTFPVIVVPRLKFTQAAHESQAALRLQKHLDAAAFTAGTQGWYLLDYAENDVQATNHKLELTEGRAPRAMRPDVANYALSKQVYAPLIPKEGG